ncbi:RDD family protein [uncultured Shewanella sp.]|uniref:RDD family protein n=1 Tax=Shewanella atlantica TaxID=271099 RepID=UPI002611AD8F|nr:RDD family protein [uncultured Shewanella sp.]
MTKTIKETDPKSIITPFAFEIAPQVLYTPLASPLKRGMAMAVDGLLIAVLAEQAGWVFILLVALTLLIQRKSHELGRILKWGLYLSMLIMMLWVTFENLSSSDSTDSDSKIQGSETTIAAPSVGEVMGYLPEIIRFSLCEEVSCAQTELASLIKVLKQTNLAQVEQKAIVAGAIKELALSDKDKALLQLQISQAYPEQGSEAVVEADNLQELAQHRPEAEGTDSGVGGERLSGEETVSTEAVKPIEPLTQPSTDITGRSGNEPSHLQELADEEAEGRYSLISWTKGILNDLGLGFGWAAFYFTVFTAWFDGQTLGKKLFRIRVIQLDGTGLSLWDAFGRYGGYGAGFATGLLGFLQIFWDANRQAIQDKISATVVVDLTKEKDESMVTLSYIEPLFAGKKSD